VSLAPPFSLPHDPILDFPKQGKQGSCLLAFQVENATIYVLPAFAVSEGIVMENAKPGSKISSTNIRVREYRSQNSEHISA
jgi:hypothetical protein